MSFSVCNIYVSNYVKVIHLYRYFGLGSSSLSCNGQGVLEGEGGGRTTEGSEKSSDNEDSICDGTKDCCFQSNNNKNRDGRSKSQTF